MIRDNELLELLTYLQQKIATEENGSAAQLGYIELYIVCLENKCKKPRLRHNIRNRLATNQKQSKNPGYATI